MFILSSVSSGLEIWSVNHTSIYINSELKFFKNTKSLNEISTILTKIHETNLSASVK